MRNLRGMARRHWISLALLAEVMLFALAYQMIWIVRPDYFRVQSDVNFLPLDLVEQAQNVRDETGQSLPIESNPDTHAAAEQIRTVYANMRRAILDLRAMKADYDRRQAQDAIAYKAFEASQWAQVDRYIRAHKEPFTSQIVTLEEKKRSLLDAARAKDGDSMPPGGLAIAFAQASVEESKLREQELSAELEAREYTLAHLVEFQTLPSQKVYLAFDRQTEALRHQLYERQVQRWKLDGQLYDAFANYRVAAQPPLTYFDFLYFSIGGATTANSADIAPNHTYVRMLFSLEIFMSVVLVGLWVNDLTKKP